MDRDFVSALPWFDQDAQRRKLAAGTLDVQETTEAVADFRQYVIEGTTRFARDWDAMKGPHGGTGFIEKVASLIHFTALGGVVCGCNAKRGNPDDKSDDGLALWDDTAPIIDINTGRRFRFRDVIAGAGSPGASAAWQDLSGTTESRGLWLQPKRVHDIDTPPPGPPPPPIRSREQFAKDFRAVNAFYAAPDGLQRVGGMVGGVDASVFRVMALIASGADVDGQTVRNAAQAVLHVQCDVDAMIAWGYELMLSGGSLERVLAAIRGSDEFKGKHS